MPATPIRRALLSVSDKGGLVDLARALGQRGVALLSTGGTAKLLREAGLAVTEVSAHTGFPEIMDGRVKTLHPKVHGGLLGRRDQDAAVMREHGIEPIDLLVVNLYPFEATIAKPGCTLEQAIEDVDVGGPAMLRAAAKNHAWVTVLVDPADYPKLLAELADQDGAVSAATRQRFAAKAFAHTARYDGAISSWLGTQASGDPKSFPPTLTLQFRKHEDLRYGENPHQRAAFYVEPAPPRGTVAGSALVQGKLLSYNNLADADAALECVRQFEAPACAIVKHANPCGVAVASDLLAAYDRAYATDQTSAFGGIIAFNRALDGATAEAIVGRQFVEVVIAPSVTPEARRAFAAKPNVRVLECGALDAALPWLDLRRIAGGLLVQDADLGRIGDAQLQVVTKRPPSAAERADLLFAWRVAKFVKSNAIVYCKGAATVGVGAGQMSRVYSARIATIKAADAGLEVRGAVMASDAFFPFRDGIDAAAAAGVSAVIQPGGSLKDKEVIAAADEHGLAMVFTGMRHFRH